SHDDTRVATAGVDGSVRVWDRVRGKEIPQLHLKGHKHPIMGVAFSPDGKTIASAAGALRSVAAGELRLWDADTGQMRATLATQGSVTYLVFTSDGKRIATCSAGGAVQLWNVADAKLERTLRRGVPIKQAGHDKAILSLALSPDDKVLASGGLDEKVVLW